MGTIYDPVTIEPYKDGWIVKKGNGDTFFDEDDCMITHDTEEDAVQWAKKNGWKLSMKQKELWTH